ncbi:restriction endonuclease subunit S [Vibrio alginolyticus]|nr:restriction endonuclease subunit S [Vibrio alginolyticus]
MTEEMNVPKLRFSEFEGFWSRKSISEVATKVTDGTHDTPKPTSSGVPYVTAIHVKDGFIDFDNCYYVSTEVHEVIYKRCNPEKGDLLIVNIGAGTATCAINTVEYEFSMKNVALVKPDRDIAEPYFLEQVQRKETAKLFHKLTSGGAQPFFSLKEIKKLTHYYPALPEQQKIASFLSKVDEKIALLTEKKDKLTEYKKGVMQQLFNGKWEVQDGQLTFIPPTLRFKADDGSEFPDWEEKKLGEVLTIGNGRDYKHLSDGDIPVFGTGGYMTSVDGYLYDGETVFIGRKGTINKPYMFNGKFWTVDTLFYTKEFKGILPKFVYAIFQKINWSLYNEATGVPSLSKSTINKIKLNLPSLSEQEKITDFISSLDQKVDLINEELEKAKEWKRGLLQQMFV